MDEPVIAEKWVVPKSVRGLCFGKDGCLLDSKEHVRAQIVRTAQRMVGVEEFDGSVTAAVERCFGKPDDQACRELFEVLRANFVCDEIRSTNSEDFVQEFVAARRDDWNSLIETGLLRARDGAYDILGTLRARAKEFFAGMYTSMPRLLVNDTLYNVFGAEDLFEGDKLVTCDDPRLNGLGKPHPRGWEILAEVAKHRSGIYVDELVCIEDQAEGIVGALQAGYGHVVVVCHSTDATFFDRSSSWDRSGLLRKHLVDVPEDAQKLVFLPDVGRVKFM